MQLNSIVKNTYLLRFEEMTLEYRLHFASRLYSWSHDSDAEALLDQLKDEIVPPTLEQRRENLFSIQTELINKDYERDVNDYARRKPFFDRYPQLLLLHSALFRIRHWYCIYDIDERPLLYELIPKTEVQKLLNELQEDKEAQRALSTYYINTMYLYKKLYQDDAVQAINPQAILELGQTYDRSNRADVQILIYLYTHCILGETLFYYQPIQQHQESYREMITELDALISTYYDTINLDNKFEFLVCARICGISSTQEMRIYEEAERSLNGENFIVDTYNQNSNPNKQSFMMSEHRNVLYIMSCSNPIFLEALNA